MDMLPFTQQLKITLLIGFALCSQSSLESQSYFYNTLQYGLRSTLLGGSVTAGSNDLSMVYYNPGALRYTSGKGLDLALIMPSIKVTDYGDFFKTNDNYTNYNFSLNPSFITYKTKLTDQFDVVLTFLQKDTWDSSINWNNQTTTADKTQAASFSYKYSGNDRWYGIGSSYELSKGISFGVSQFWSDFRTRYNYTVTDEIINNQSGSRESLLFENLSLSYKSSFSMVTKMGLSISFPNDRIGIVATSPRYATIFPSGSYVKTNTVQENGDIQSSEIANYGLESQTQSGWQFNLGYARKFGDFAEIWLSASAHTAVPEYKIFSVTNIQGNTTHLMGGASSVQNIALGLTCKINDKIQFLSSFRTNFLAYENQAIQENIERVNVLESDLTHLTAGLNIQSENSSFVIGLDWGFAQDDNNTLFQHFPNINRFDRNQTSFNQNTLTLLVTYEFILDSVSKNISNWWDKLD